LKKKRIYFIYLFQIKYLDADKSLADMTDDEIRQDMKRMAGIMIDS
jgi:hypothetical protein